MNKFKTKIWALCLPLLITGSFVVCFFNPETTAFGSDLIKVHAAISIADPIYTHHYVALSKGFYKEEGLDIRTTVTGGGSLVAQLIAANQADIALGNPEHTIKLTKKGRPAKILMAIDRKNTWANVVVRKDLLDSGKVKKLEDLKGMKVGVTRIGSGSWFYGSYIMDQVGIRESIQFTGVGGVKSILGALKTKQVAATMGSKAVYETARKEGYGDVLFDSKNDKQWNRIFGGPVPGSVVYALTKTVEERPDIVKRFIGAMKKTNAFMKKASAQDIAEMLHVYMPSYDLDTLSQTVALYQASYWSWNGIITKDNYEVLLGIIGDGRIIENSEKSDFPYDKMVNLDFLE